MAENARKVIVIGDGYVGKTCFVSKVTEGKFLNNYKQTIGVEYGVKTFRRGTSDVRLTLWDLAGQDRFRHLMPAYTRKSSAAIVMCDITNRQTLEGAKNWKELVDSTVFLPNGQPIPCILLVNKHDLPNSRRQMTSEEIFTFARDNGFTKYFETSVKDGANVNEALEYVVDVILAFEEDGQILTADYESGINLTTTYSQRKREQSTCCSHS